MSFRAIRVVAAYEVERLARSPHGAAVVLLFVMLYGSAAYSLRRLVESIPGGQMDHDGQHARGIAQFVGEAVDLAPDALTGIFRDHPPMLIAVFALALAVTPLLAVLMSSDQTATDIRTRHLRFLLLRTDRLSLFLGRALGTLAAFAIAQAAAMAAVVLAIGVSRVEGAGGALYLVRAYSATVLLATPCVALMAALGALAAHASRGLMLAMLVWMVVSIAVAASDGDLEPLRYVLPSAMKHHAISDRAVDLGPLAAFQLAYTVVALAAGFAVFRRRDV
jgi:Cu-processing system permease protein